MPCRDTYSILVMTFVFLIFLPVLKINEEGIHLKLHIYIFYVICTHNVTLYIFLSGQLSKLH